MHTLAEGYRWSYEECVKRTYPQIIMLGHAAHVAKQRMDKRLEQNKKKTAPPVDEPIFNGKRLDELSSDEYVAYYSGRAAHTDEVHT